MINFFKEDERVREVCHYLEESFREAAATMWGQANKIDKLKTENAKLKRENEQLKTGTFDMMKPQPCTSFRYAGTAGWVAKLNEEVYEAMLESAYVERLAAEADDDDVACLAEELTDVITVCVSWLNALGYDEYMRGELHRHVNEKNKARGYF